MALSTLEQYIQAIAMMKADENTRCDEDIFTLRDTIQEALWEMASAYTHDIKFYKLLTEYRDDYIKGE